MNTITTKTADDIIRVSSAPEITGLAFRHFRGEEDYPAIMAVIEGSKNEDQIETTTSVEGIATAYKHLTNCNPYQDMLFAEMDGRVIGYSRVWWYEESARTLIYSHIASLLPEWRNRGIRRAMLHYNEQRLREIASSHPPEADRFFEAVSEDTEIHWSSLLISEGYTPARYFLKMARSLREDLPDLPMPGSYRILPVQPEQYEAIFKAAIEAYEDAWGSSQLDYEMLKKWTEGPTFNPELWQVAWDSDCIAGLVLNFIDEKENEEYHRRWGTMKLIAVCQPYRRKGLAKALIAQSFRVLKEHGMCEAVLSADVQDLTGALNLYKNMGFIPIKQFTTYRKPMD